MSNAKLSLATYSAHASILNVLNQKCAIERLFVNAGGLRVPPGIRSDKPYLSKYRFVKGKTLHAKVAFFSEGNKKGDVWLWTGNLRKSTFESQNILMSFPIGKDINKLEKWFSEGCKQHIVFKCNGNKIIEIPKLNKLKSAMWGNFKESLLNIESEKAWKAEDDIHIYIFSPWGAKKVVKEIRDFFGKVQLSLYTQAAADDENVWVDCCKEDERYVADADAKFPHFKCMFVCRGTELVWSYVGSANFTQSAMLEHKNVEHALFFEGKKYNKDQQILLEQLKKLGWEKRDSEIKFDKKKEKEDPNVEQKYESRYDPQSFIEQDIANKVLAEFSTKKKQKELEASYTKNKGKGAKVESKDKKYELKVLALEREQIYVRVYPKNSLTFELSIPRKNAEKMPIVTQADVSAKFDELDSIAFGNGNGSGGGSGPKKGDGKKDAPTNVRFPMEFYKGDSETKKETRRRALKIIEDLQNQHLDDLQKLKLDIWFPLLKRLGV